MIMGLQYPRMSMAN